MGIAQRPPSGRNAWQSVRHYFIELDVVGMFLTVAGWSLLLLPFNLASTAPNGWRTDYVIAMIVVGFSLLVAFVLWEKYFATVPYFPFRFLKDRTILGASLLQGFMFASIFCWDTYYQSYLQVVHQQSITTSGYILNSFSLASAFFGPFIGLIMRYTGEYKWMGISGIPFVVLGTVLLIHFRTPETAVGYLVMCQIFNGIGTGIWSITGQLGVMASVNHQEVAVALALYSMFGSIGSGIGQAVAGSLWTNTLFDELVRRLPEEFKDQAATIYGDIEVQMSYPMGSDVRNAINGAYADVQRKMVIAGSAFLPVLVICVVVWKNISLKQKSGESGQPKGNVW